VRHSTSSTVKSARGEMVRALAGLAREDLAIRDQISDHDPMGA